ncbi:hypothetical protein KAFR_0B05210 [Kazachstania africana CBS 2517]|uniref:STB6-like N-terminal domain-containing protein n=1 Tax=Kazachstania africana (strain ATCC 22294 / BCRC 22015 / CBS 2517 / CECT 1963 / NBRC 1671 / NRRL Y-8276) TaxID=1071382 RepID=H2AR17_KAZAF|nr:hypothetical protein KAFR_0B05210 [Kazachstania africana CBS 2517]CCF56817.1 hypothetical protein KAFR_0B05210 [Kazachstania africana CBS 2517]
MSNSLVNAYSHYTVPSGRMSGTAPGTAMPNYGYTKNSLIDPNKRKAYLQVESYIFPDMKALYQLDLASYVDLTYDKITIYGFEIYLVEQWISERKLSSVITSFTGNTQDTITAIQVLLPKNPSLWPGKFKQYREDLLKFSQPKLTDWGQLFITNLSAFPSGLNILHVECGNMKLIWENFKINFDLKMLNCTGRSLLLLNAPSNSSIEKFSQIYKIPAPNEPISPVIQMIELVQMCLHYFNRYNGKIDGLYCSHTKAAINSWWEDYGKLYLAMERPKNEILLGPTTVAALLSLVLSCFFKLILEDCVNNAKDPFNDYEFFSAIFNFQKKYGLRRDDKAIHLDHRTVAKLFEVTVKFSSNDFFKFKKIFKSKLQDLLNKNKNPIHLANNLLTHDLDTLVSNIKDINAGSLWNGNTISRSILINEQLSDFRFFKFQKGNPNLQLNEQDALIKSGKWKGFLDDITYDLKLQSLAKQFDPTIFIENRPFGNLASSTSNDNRENNKGGGILSLSNQSSSSMFANYDKSKYSNAADLNKNYYREFHRRNSVPLVNDGTLNEPFKDVDEEDDIFLRQALYRSNSVSRISNLAEDWSLPFDPSIVKIARNLKKIDVSLERQQRMEDMRSSKFNYNSEKNDIIQEEIKFGKFKQMLQENYDKYAQTSTDFDRESKFVENQQQVLLTEMKEINSLSSKLRYDVRILEFRMRDVENSVTQFDLKLKNLKKTFRIQDVEVSNALDAVSDNDQFEKCLTSLTNSNSGCYASFYLRMASRNFFTDLKNDILAWANYIFKSFRNHKPDEMPSY